MRLQMLDKLKVKSSYLSSLIRNRISFWCSDRDSLIEGAFDNELPKDKNKMLFKRMGEKSYSGEMRKRVILKNAIQKFYVLIHAKREQEALTKELRMEKELAWERLKERIESSNEVSRINVVRPSKPDFALPMLFKGGAVVAVASTLIFFLPGVYLDQNNELQEHQEKIVAHSNSASSVSAFPLNTDEVSYRLNAPQFRISNSLQNFHSSGRENYVGYDSQLISESTLNSLSDESSIENTQEDFVSKQKMMLSELRPFYFNEASEATSQASFIHFVSGE